ncbi:hypothetical protein BC830DRAFT_435709 [Chytriomyces sp. MP71]|nr:hypothetical protein BC830DRAFT_435709 [Chytriomyces sp. MP71]
MACPGHEPHDAVIAHALRHMASGGGVPLAIGALPEPCGSLYPSRPTNMGLATTPTAMTSSEAGATPASCARSLARASPDADLPWHFSWIDSDSAIGGSSAPTERRHWRALRDANVGLVVNLTESPVSPPRPPHSRARDCVSTVNPLASADMDGLLFGTAWDDISTSSTSPAADVDKLEYGGICAKCGHVDDVYDSDLFADVALPPHSLSPHSPVSQASDADDSDSSSTTVTDVTSGMAVLFLPIPDGSVPRFEQLDIFLKEANTTIRAGKKVIVHCQAGKVGIHLACPRAPPPPQKIVSCQ